MAKGFARLGILYTLLSITYSAHAVTVGDLLISEVMVNPAAVSDTLGEWFELYNPTGDVINLRDITIGDDGVDSHKIETDLLIMPGHFLTLARNGDTALNGGFNADYVYDDFTLANSGDEIVLTGGTTEWLRLDYGSGFDEAGISRELAVSPMVADNYALTLAGLTYGLGDIGTPGAPGSVSLAPSAVPLPAAAWLFISAMLALLSPNLLKNIGRCPKPSPRVFAPLAGFTVPSPRGSTASPKFTTSSPRKRGVSYQPGAVTRRDSLT